MDSSDESIAMNQTKQLVTRPPCGARDYIENSQCSVTQKLPNNAWREEESSVKDFIHLFESADDPTQSATANLDAGFNELTNAWQKFRERFPFESDKDLEKRPQTMDDVIKAVQSAESEWARKRDQGAWRIPKKYFHKFCRTLDSHSTMLQVLPAQSQYVSLFYGTLQSLIKASVNYQQIAEGLSKSLTEINEISQACIKDVNLFPTLGLKTAVSNLYAQIFLFLSEVMKWYSRKSRSRLLESFRDDFYKEFADRIVEIKRISESVAREAAHVAQFEGHITQLRVKDVQDATTSLLRESRMDRVIRTSFEEQVACGIASVNQLLLDIRRDQESNALLLEDGVHILSKTRLQESCIDDNTLKPRDLDPLRVTRVQVQLNSKTLEDFFEVDSGIVPFDLTGPYYVEEEIATSLKHWTRNPESQVLCIVGPSRYSMPSSLALLSAYHVSLSNLANIPIIHHICVLPQVEAFDGTTREAGGLVALVYSLIKQLVGLLPPEIDGNYDFTVDRFCGLDGTLNTWKEAISVLNDLLDLSPPNLSCVIDGLQQLDDESTDNHLKVMISALRRQTKAEHLTSSNVSKLLFTTAGISRALMDSLSIDDFVLAEHSSVAHVPGQAMPGRQLLVYDFQK